MADCDRCGNETDANYVLNHVHIDKSPISSMHSEYRVCPACYTQMKADPDITWSGSEEDDDALH